MNFFLAPRKNGWLPGAMIAIALFAYGLSFRHSSFATTDACAETVTLRAIGADPNPSAASAAVDQIRRALARPEAANPAAFRRALLQTIRERPDEAIAILANSTARKTVTAKFSGCVHDRQSVTGRVEAMVVENITTEVGERTVYVVDDANQRVELHPSQQGPTLISGQRIRARGLSLANGSERHLLVDADLDAVSILAQPGNPPVVGDQKTVVLLGYFQDTPQPTWGPDDIRSLIYGTVRGYYRAMSNNTIDIIGAVDRSGDVYGWYPLPVNKTCTDLDGSMGAMLTAANADVDYTLYTRIIFVAPFGESNHSCWWGGSATYDRLAIQTPDGPITGSLMWSNDINNSLFHFGHELGHNFGNDHAMFLDCGSVALGDSCNSSEYGDPYSILGSRIAAEWNIAHREYVGWFGPAEVAEALTSGTYRIQPIENNAAGTRGVRIPRGNGDYLEVEYRQPLGYDVGIDVNPATPVFDGALVHLNTAARPNNPSLIDPTPPSDRYGAILLPGIVLTDPLTGVALEVSAPDATGITLTVTYPDSTAPDAVSNLMAT